MYTPPAFREMRAEVLRDAIRSYPLATLVTHGDGGLEASLVPLLIVEDAGERPVLRGHLARNNPQLEVLRRGGEVMALFQGPQAYVSPSWYATKQEHGKVVPTWNYVVVSAWGVARVVEDADWLRAQIGALTEQQEGHRVEPWAVSDAPDAFIAAQLDGISGVEIVVDRLEGKWKASQNQPEANRRGVTEGLRKDDPGSAMAALMDKLEGQR